MLNKNRRTILDWTITNFVMAIFFVTATLSGIFLAVAVSHVQSMADEQNRILLNAVLDRTESFLEQTTSGMRELGDALFELSANDDDTLARIIDGVRIGSINLRSIDVIGSDARIQYSSPYNATAIGNDVSGREAYQRVVAEGTSSWSRVFYADFLDDVVVTFYVPAGRYVLAGNLSLKRLWNSMEKIDVADETRLSIIDSNGAYIYNSDLGKVERRMFASDRNTLMDAVENGVRLVRHTDQGEEVRTEVAAISGTKWIVAVHQDLTDQSRARRKLIAAALFVMVVTMLAGVVHIRRIARRKLEPFSQLQSIALRVADGEYDVEYPQSRFVEITSLSESFRSMVAGITRREMSLRDARDEAEQASRIKSELLANVSHEFRTSLNGILGMASLLSKTGLDESQSEYLQAQLRAAHVLKRLVDDLLMVSGDQPAVPSPPSETDLHKAVNSFETALNHEEAKVNFTWINEIPPGTLAKADQEQLGQIVYNLVSNAQKYTHEGVIKVRWNLLTEPDQQSVLQLIVSDTGIGIPPEDRERVFESFVQIDPTHTKIRRGLGLGLAIVRRSCHQAGGTVSISDNTEEGRGTVITVRILVELVPDASATILIVEDEVLNRLYLSTLLKQKGYAVSEYKSGVPLIDEPSFPEGDIILMDIGLPRISGAEVTRKLRKRGVTIPIIALTAYSSQRDVDGYREAGMSGFVPKPITESILFRVIRKALSGDEWTV